MMRCRLGHWRQNLQKTSEIGYLSLSIKENSEGKEIGIEYQQTFAYPVIVQ